MHSMTGFGRGSVLENGWEVICEIRSVNHRGVDVKVRMPRELAASEPAIIGLVKRQFARGRFDLFINCNEQSAGGPQVRLDQGAAKHILDDLQSLAKERKDLSAEVCVGDLLHLKDLFTLEEVHFPEAMEESMFRALDMALNDLEDTRRQEGDGLKSLLLEHLSRSETLGKSIRSRCAGGAERWAAKLKGRLADFALPASIDPERMTQEIALIADRLDVTEELERLRLHVGHFISLVNGGGPIGRKLDFLCQELLREGNTIGSKVQDTEAAHAVVELKAEVERLREQVQNVE